MAIVDMHLVAGLYNKLTDDDDDDDDDNGGGDCNGNVNNDHIY